MVKKKSSCERLIIVTGAEIWMSGNLVSGDSLLWNMNIPKRDFMHQKIDKEFWYLDCATCAYLKQVPTSNMSLRQYVCGQLQIQVYEIPDSLTS